MKTKMMIAMMNLMMVLGTGTMLAGNKSNKYDNNYKNNGYNIEVQAGRGHQNNDKIAQHDNTYQMNQTAPGKNGQMNQAMPGKNGQMNQTAPGKNGQMNQAMPGKNDKMNQAKPDKKQAQPNICQHCKKNDKHDKKCKYYDKHGDNTIGKVATTVAVTAAVTTLLAALIN